jgi:TolB-like protein
MIKNTKKLIRIDLNQFKFHLHLKSDTELTLHFDSPSRRFYLTVIVLVIQEMKKRGKIAPVPLHKFTDILALLNETIGGTAGSSEKEYLLPRIYRKWKDALPDLENAPLFKVVGRTKKFDEMMDKVYIFSEEEKDRWANLFEYSGSHENVRLRFSIDRFGSNLDDILINYGEQTEQPGLDTWDDFIEDLKSKIEDNSKPVHFDQEPEEQKAIPALVNQVPEPKPDKFEWPLLFVLGLFVILTAGFAFWHTQIFSPQVEIDSVGTRPLPLSEKPSIAVLPFRNLSDDREQEYLSDGMTDDIITDLSNIKGISVISRNSTFLYKGQNKKATEIAKELNVRYILEGSVRRSGEKVRINAQLIDANNDHNIWAERFDDIFQNIFDLQDQITAKIIVALALRLSVTEQQTITDKGTDNIAAYDAFLKGMSHVRRFTPQDYVEAVDCFKNAIKLDPDYSNPYAALAFAYWNTFSGGNKFYEELNIDFEFSRVLARDYLRTAMKKPTAYSYILMALMELWRRHYRESIEYAEKAVTTSPNNADVLTWFGLILTANGNPEMGIEYQKKAIMLDPLHGTTMGIGVAYFTMGKYEEAVKYIEKGLSDKPEMIPFFAFSAAAHAFIGNDDQAKKAYEKWSRFRGKYGMNTQFLYYAYGAVDASTFHHLMEGLVKADHQADISSYHKIYVDQKLNGQEIKKLMFGKTQIGGYFSSQFYEYRSEDGILSAPDSYGGTHEGRSWVEDDELCNQYDFLYSRIKYCGDIYQNIDGDKVTKSEYLMVTDFGIQPFSVKVGRGL